MHQCALHDPQIAPDAKAQVWQNVSWCASCVIRTELTRARNIVHQLFAPQTHQNAVRDTQIALDAKTQVPRNVSRCAFYGIRTGPT
jgi:hypothetical protein